MKYKQELTRGEYYAFVPDYFGIFVRNQRHEHKWTLQRVASGAGISKGHLCDIEHGNLVPKITTALSILGALGWKLSLSQY